MKLDEFHGLIPSPRHLSSEQGGLNNIELRSGGNTRFHHAVSLLDVWLLLLRRHLLPFCSDLSSYTLLVRHLFSHLVREEDVRVRRALECVGPHLQFGLDRYGWGSSHNLQGLQGAVVRVESTESWSVVRI